MSFFKKNKKYIPELVKIDTDASLDKIIYKRNVNLDNKTNIHGDPLYIELNEQLETTKKTLAETQSKLDSKEKELNLNLVTCKKANEQLETTKKTLAETQSKLDSKEKELNLNLVTCKKANEQLETTKKTLAETQSKLDSMGGELLNVKAYLLRQNEITRDANLRVESYTLENDLVLMHFLNAQEQIVEYYDEKIEFKKLYLEAIARCERLQKRLPGATDFEYLAVTDVDSVSDTPSVDWTVNNLTVNNLQIEEIVFSICLQNGHPAVGIMGDKNFKYLVPKLVITDKNQTSQFIKYSTKEYLTLKAMISIFEQAELNYWQDIKFKDSFDLNFWRPYIKSLVLQFKQLPSVLRHDEIKLKRELVNPDYEHLWFEFYGLSFGERYWKKFEIRLGAANIVEGKFSTYPKLEIPLIDGFQKPFESWYEESVDDDGAKLELRFSLEKKIYDVEVWTRLTEQDKALILRLIYLIPTAIKNLEIQKLQLHRPFDIWGKFSIDVIKVIESVKNVEKNNNQSGEPTQNTDSPNTKLTNRAELIRNQSSGIVSQLDSKNILHVVNEPNNKMSDAKLNFKRNASKKLSKGTSKRGSN